MKLTNHLRTGSGVVIVAAVWAALDALVHVAVDMVEPPRIAGNIAVWVACAISLVAFRVAGGPKLAAVACGLAAGIVLGLNLAWVNVNSELPVPVAVFFGLALVLILLAANRIDVVREEVRSRVARSTRPATMRAAPPASGTASTSS